jgi:hypothetical protein
VLVGATSLWPLHGLLWIIDWKPCKWEWTLCQVDDVVLFADVKSRGYNENTHSHK